MTNPRIFQVYLSPRKGKIHALKDTTISGKIPATLTVEGRVWHFVGADLTKNTITFAEVKPPPPIVGGLGSGC